VRPTNRALLGGTAGALLLATIAGLAVAEALTLRYTPEQGLAVSYKGEGSGTAILNAMGNKTTQKIGASMEFTDRIQAVQGENRVLSRTFQKMVLRTDGQNEDAPDEVLKQERSFTLSALGAVVEASNGGSAGNPMQGMGFDPMSLDLLPIIVVPFAEKPVSVGDSWDTSKSLLYLGEGGKGRNVKAQTKLVSVYESDGMRVALTQTEWTAEGDLDVNVVVQGEPPAGAPPLPTPKVTIRFSGDVLQSSRIDDGCVLGRKSKVSGSANATMGEGVSFSMQIKDWTSRLEVAG